MPHEFKHRQVEVISKSIAGISSFTKLINIPFVVKEMRVKNIAYKYDGTETTMGIIRMNSIDQKIGSFSDSQTNHPEISFSINQNITGTQSFQILDVLDGLENGLAGDLCLILEFLG